MSHPDLIRVLGLLDPAVAAEVQRGLDTELVGFKSDHFAAACALVGFASPIPWPRVPTPAQRPLAEILAYEEAYAGYGCAMPRSARARRRFLGLEPATVLEQGEPPLWHVLQSSSDPAATVRRLSARDRVAFVLAAPHDYHVPEPVIEAAVPTVDELVALGEALTGVADEAAAVKGTTIQGGIPNSLRGRLFLALVRAGIPIDGRWDDLFPRQPSATLPEMREAADALTEPRRTQAILLALSRDHQADEAALSLLATHPSKRLARFLVSSECFGNLPKKIRRARLDALLAARPDVSAVVGSKARAHARPSVSASHVLAPATFDELSDVQAAQLKVAAGPLYDAPPGSPRDWFVSFVPLVDEKGRPAYDVVRMMVDSGAVFRAGTTQVVASIVQFGVEADDQMLADAVEAALFQLSTKGKRET